MKLARKRVCRVKKTNLETRYRTKRGWKLELSGIKKQKEVTDNNDGSKSKIWHKERVGNESLLMLSEEG